MNIDDEWSNFLNNTNEKVVYKNKENVPDIIPTCSKINISTSIFITDLSTIINFIHNRQKFHFKFDCQLIIKIGDKLWVPTYSIH